MLDYIVIGMLRRNMSLALLAVKSKQYSVQIIQSSKQ